MAPKQFSFLPLLFISCFIGTVKADGWDDFTNNLASDLAPLLALFGEQVTKQFLSESTSAWDNFIFAMAPMGVLTAVVSAIRVCGGPSLRAFIGRAQEGGGVAEAELCSSTSRDVCELYHNGAIVRVFGRPKILEIVHNPEGVDFHANTNDAEPPNYGLYTFQDYMHDPKAIKEGWEEVADTPNDTETPKKPNEDEFAPNPNLSFNIGMRKRYGYITWIAAAVGLFSQSSVVVFGGIVTYKFGWKKDDLIPPPWAFPLMSLGTILLCGGMYYCAFLVETSTKERIFNRNLNKNPNKDPSETRHPPSTLYVIQPGNQVIGDQTFDSFAFVDSNYPLQQYITSWKSPHGNVAQIGVWFAIIITMSGFILQFVGLRSMHATVSLLQLGVIMLMSMIRAGLRTRRLEEKDNLLRPYPDVVEGFELDWLALQMSNEQRKPEDRNNASSWSVIGLGDQEDSQRGLNDESHTSSTVQFNSDDSSSSSDIQAATKAFRYRCQLAEMTKRSPQAKSKSSRSWEDSSVHVRQHSRQLKKAIESTAKVLFTHAKQKPGWKEDIVWAIDVGGDSQGSGSGNSRSGDNKTSQIQLGIIKPSPKPDSQAPTFIVNQQHLEAVLGLWTWSITSESLEKNSNGREFKQSEASDASMHRIIAARENEEDIKQAKTDINFWFGDLTMAISTKTWGSSPAIHDRCPDARWTIGETKKVRKTHHLIPSLRFFGWQSPELQIPHNPESEMVTLTTEITDISLSIACAHEIYQSFLYAIVTGFDSIGGKTEPVKGIRGFYLTNEVLSSLVKAFQESGLGSTQDAYSIIIPALRHQSKLPLPRDAVPMASNLAIELRKNKRFTDAEDILKWILQITSENNGDDTDTPGRRQQAEILLELGELYRHAHFSKDQPLEEFVNEGRDWMRQYPAKSDEIEALKSRYTELLGTDFEPRTQSIIDAVSKGNRVDCLDLMSRQDDFMVSDDDGRTVLSWAAQQGWPEVVKAVLEIGSVVDSEDKSKRTPLSYAAEYGHAEIVRILMAAQALPIAEDTSYRQPLSYAAARGWVEVMRVLLDDPRVNLHTRDNSGQSPLHWASKGGHEPAVEWLLQGKANKDDVDLNDHTPLIAALLNQQEHVANILVSHKAKLNIFIDQTEAWIWAANRGEWLCTRFLLRHLNHESKSDLAKNPQNKKAVLCLLCYDDQEIDVSEIDTPDKELAAYVYSGNGVSSTITNKTIQEFVSFDAYFFKLLFFRKEGAYKEATAPVLNNRANLFTLMIDCLDEEVEITHDTLEAIATNEHYCIEWMRSLLHTRGNKIKMTDPFLAAVLRNRQHNLELIQLLDDAGHKFKIPNHSIAEVVANEGGYEIIKKLLEKWGEKFEITVEFVKKAVANEECGLDLIKLLLAERGNEFKITNDVFKEAMANTTCGLDLIKLFLAERGNEFKITNDVFKEAVANTIYGLDLIKLFLTERGNEFKITDDIIKEAVANTIYGLDLIKLFLAERRNEFKITDNIIKEAMANTTCGLDLTKLFLAEKGNEFKITDSIIKEAMANRTYGFDLIKLFLAERGNEFKITEDIVKAAASSEYGGTDIIELLLEKRGNEFKITEDIIQAAIPPGWGAEIIELLLEKRGNEFKITEDIVKAAASSEYGGTDIIELLLEKRGNEFKITEDIVKAAASSRWGNKTIELLLKKRGNEFKITEDIVKAAASSRWGNKTIELLLKKRGNEFKITENIVKAAADNSASGKYLTYILFNRRGKVQVTEEGMKLLEDEYSRLFLD